MSGIQILKLPFKYLQKNIRITVIGRAIFIFTQLAEVSISYSGEVNHCWHLHPCRFRKLLHVTYPFCRLSNLLNPLVVSRYLLQGIQIWLNSITGIGINHTETLTKLFG